MFFLLVTNRQAAVGSSTYVVGAYHTGVLSFVNELQTVAMRSHPSSIAFESSS